MSGAFGVSVSVSVEALYETEAGTVVDPATSVNVVAVRVDGSMSRENFAVTAVDLSTPVAPLPGERAVTVGAAGACAAVVKVHVTAALRGTPSIAVIAVDSFAV